VDLAALGGGLMLTGALMGGWAQTALFGAALAVDWGGTYVLFKRRVLGSTSRERPVVLAVLLVAIPAGIVAPPLAALAGVVVILGALIAVETARYPNFVEEPADASRFFDPETWARLRQIKSRYDGDDLFVGNHHIPPAT
jgi:hypothetical protein